MPATAAVFVLAGGLGPRAEVGAVLLSAKPDLALLAFAAAMFTSHETSLESGSFTLRECSGSVRESASRPATPPRPPERRCSASCPSPPGARRPGDAGPVRAAAGSPPDGK